MSFHSFKVIKASWSQHRNEHIKHHAKWSKLLTNHSPKSFFTIRVDNKQHQAMTWTTIIHSYHVEVTPYSFWFKFFQVISNEQQHGTPKKLVVWVSVSPFLRRYCQFPCLFLGDVFLRMVVPYVFSCLRLITHGASGGTARNRRSVFVRKIHDVKSNDPMKTKISPHVLIRLRRH